MSVVSSRDDGMLCGIGDEICHFACRRECVHKKTKSGEEADAGCIRNVTWKRFVRMPLDIPCRLLPTCSLPLLIWKPTVAIGRTWAGGVLVGIHRAHRVRTGPSLEKRPWESAAEGIRRIRPKRGRRKKRDGECRWWRGYCTAFGGLKRRQRTEFMSFLTLGKINLDFYRNCENVNKNEFTWKCWHSYAFKKYEFGFYLHFLHSLGIFIASWYAAWRLSDKKLGIDIKRIDIEYVEEHTYLTLNSIYTLGCQWR